MNKLSLVLAIAFSSLGAGFATHSHNCYSFTPNIGRKETKSSHPVIQGFDYAGGFTERRLVSQNNTGYFYWDLNFYQTEYTDVSNLFLAHIHVEFTSGYIANKNGESFEGKKYDSAYDLDEGYVHVKARNSNTLTYKSSTLNFIGAWPSSDNFTFTMTSTTSHQVSFNAGGSVNYSIGHGLKITGNAGIGYTLIVSDSTSISGPEPKWSKQASSSDAMELQWNYDYEDLGRVTLAQDCYYLFEVCNDGTGPNNDFSFLFDVEIKMSNVKYKNYWWESHKDTSEDYECSYGVR